MVMNFAEKLNNSLNFEKNSDVLSNSLLTDITKDLVNAVDLNDKTYIVRNKSEEEMRIDINTLELKESIEDLGVCDPVYYQKRDDGKYRIVAGYSRTIVFKMLFEEGKSFYCLDSARILPKNADQETLEKINIFTNLKRKNPTLLDYAKRLMNEKIKYNMTLEEIGNKYKMPRTTISRIIRTLEYPKPLINLFMETQQIIVTDLIYKIMIKKNLDPQEAVDTFRGMTTRELESELRNIKRDKPIIKVDYKKRRFNIKFEIIPDETVKEIVKEFEKKIENYLLEKK